MLSDEWLSRYGLLENFNTSVTRTRTGTWMTGVTAILLCTSCSRANDEICTCACMYHQHSPILTNGLNPVHLEIVTITLVLLIFVNSFACSR